MTHINILHADHITIFSQTKDRRHWYWTGTYAELRRKFIEETN